MNKNTTDFECLNKFETAIKDTDLNAHQATLINDYMHMFHSLKDDLLEENKQLQHKLKAWERKHNYYVYTDPLTCLPNQNKLDELLSDCHITDLCLIDITSFININNFYGNHVGDQVLSAFSKLITHFTTECGYSVFRIYADIFAIISTKADDTINFVQFMRILQHKIHNHPFLPDSHNIYIQTTMALAKENKCILEKANMALEYGKTQKINFVKYDTSLNLEKNIETNLHWSAKVRDAIKNDRIVPYFQPIHNNSRDVIDHYETLMRMIDNDGSIISPGVFIPIAKKANLYKQLTRTIIKKSMDYFKGLPHNFSINISSEDIEDRSIRQYILSELDIFPNPNRVIFEIVESEGIENFDGVIQFIKSVRDKGARIAIDDFGTGFSNFHYLFKLNVDIIKIDGSIIENITNEYAAKSVAETIVAFADKMNITTIAEFVSSQEIFDKTKDLGIGYSQGYYVAKPQREINFMEDEL